MNIQIKIVWNQTIVLAILILIYLFSFSHTCGIDNIVIFFLYPFKMYCLVLSPIHHTLPWHYGIKTTRVLSPDHNETGENYFFFHFDITFVIAQINFVSPGNVYSYTTLRNILPTQQYFDFSVFWYTSLLHSSSLYNIPWKGYFPFRYQLMNMKPE